MINGKLILIFACVALCGCNGGLNLTIPTPPMVETSPIIVDPSNPSTTPTPVQSPTPVPPTTSGKNRVFVSRTFVTMQGTASQPLFEQICACEARKARIPGKFTALVATSDAAFSKKYSVTGSIYQKVEGAEIQVADSFEDLINGKNNGIYANAYQHDIQNSYKNYAWTGQKDFHQPAPADYNCKDWSVKEGFGIVGQVGAMGSDSLATQFQECDILAHLYCIEYQ